MVSGTIETVLLFCHGLYCGSQRIETVLVVPAETGLYFSSRKNQNCLCGSGRNVPTIILVAGRIETVLLFWHRWTNRSEARILVAGRIEIVLLFQHGWANSIEYGTGSWNNSNCLKRNVIF